MTKPVLIVEDDRMQSAMLAKLLQKKLGFHSYAAKNGHDALNTLNNEAGDIRLVIMDINMPVMNGFEAMEIMRERYPQIPIVMLTGSTDKDDAAKAIQLGAVDYITKPYDAERIVITVKNALKLSLLSKEVARLRSDQEDCFTFDHLIGHDDGLRDVIALSQKAADTNIPLLITGETGVGKEVFARAIHGAGPRAGKPFIAVNCGAIPSQLVESTLFGHEKGSFTGAISKVIGKFREAEGGTIFLDEVGELPLDTQVKLLRVLQQKEVEPVGAGKSVPVNVRIVSATNRNLPKEVEIGRFREDLYFRLNVLEIILPPLRERKEDIPALAQHFIERQCATDSKALCELSPEARKKLMQFDWPGNVRQLENAIARAIVLSEDSILRPDNFTIAIKEAAHTTAKQNDALHIDLILEDVIKPFDILEQEILSLALMHCDHNVSAAAKALGIAKSTFYRKMPAKTFR